MCGIRHGLLLLVLLAISEQAILAWLVLWPLRDHLSHLSNLQAWVQEYSLATANVDVWVLSTARATATYLLVASAPTEMRRLHSHDDSSVPQLGGGVSAAAFVCATLLLLKAVAVAVSAPDDTWPRPCGRDRGPAVVGLYYTFLALGVCLLSSVVGALVAKAALWHCQRRLQQEVDPLTAPLLPAKSLDRELAAAAGPASAPARGIWQLLRLSAPDWPLLLVAFVAGAGAAWATALVPYYTGRIIDYASLDPDRHLFNQTTIRLLLTALVMAVLSGVRGSLFILCQNGVNVRTRRQLFKSLLAQEIGFYDTNKLGEVVSRLTADIETISQQVGLNVNVLMRSTTAAVIVLFFMFLANWRLSIVTLVFVPVGLLVGKAFGRVYSKLSKQVQESLAKANVAAEEVLSSMTTVKAHAAERSAEAGYAEKLGDFSSVQRQQAMVYAGYAMVTVFLPVATASVVVWYGGSLVLSGKMSAGSLVSFLLYEQSLVASCSSVVDVFTALCSAVGAADKVLELMYRTPAVPPPGHLVPAKFAGELELRNVTFRYPSRPETRVLNGLSLVVNAGEVVALVGPSGGGKSSLVKLLERFYLPQTGAVLIDGVDVGAYDARWLRRRVAMVSQEPVLYARSIKRNILYGLEPQDGCETPKDEEVRALV